ncbi:MAG: hypothetical protein FD161_5008, partial [Limisphaerales bacterium]
MNATQEWNFATEADAVLHPKGPKPTPERMRKLLRREEENLESLLPGSTTTPAAATPEAPPRDDGRNPLGRFGKGNKGGTGNPFARQVAGFRAALINSVTAADFAEIAQVLQCKAKNGDLAAIKLFLAYTVGKPTAPPDPDRLDLEDFQLLRERLSTLEQDWLLIRKMVPVEGIIEAGHRVADLRAESWREEVLGQEREPPQAQVPAKSAEDLLLDQLMTRVWEDAANGGDVKALACMEKLLREAHRTGCLRETLAKLREEFAEEIKSLDATKAEANASQAPPSTNGGTAATAPSTSGGTA